MVNGEEDQKARIYVQHVPVLGIENMHALFVAKFIRGATTMNQMKKTMHGFDVMIAIGFRTPFYSINVEFRWVMTKCDNIEDISIYDDSNPNHLHYSCPLCRGDLVKNTSTRNSKSKSNNTATQGTYAY